MTNVYRIALTAFCVVLLTACSGAGLGGGANAGAKIAQQKSKADTDAADEKTTRPLTDDADGEGNASSNGDVQEFDADEEEEAADAPASTEIDVAESCVLPEGVSASPFGGAAGIPGFGLGAGWDGTASSPELQAIIKACRDAGKFGPQDAIVCSADEARCGSLGANCGACFAAAQSDSSLECILPGFPGQGTPN